MSMWCTPQIRSAASDPFDRQLKWEHRVAELARIPDSEAEIQPDPASLALRPPPLAAALSGLTPC